MDSLSLKSKQFHVENRTLSVRFGRNFEKRTQIPSKHLYNPPDATHSSDTTKETTTTSTMMVKTPLSMQFLQNVPNAYESDIRLKIRTEQEFHIIGRPNRTGSDELGVFSGLTSPSSSK